MLQSILSGVRVLDVSQGIAGPLCARLLGDFGADVLKVEPPEGDCSRRMPPFAGDVPDPEKSLFYLMMNLNKRGITLNLETKQGADIFGGLAREADVIIENFTPGHLTRLGLDHEVLARDNSGLVMTSITPFGQSGPYSRYKGEEIVAYATGGIMAISGTADREPLKHGGFQAHYEAGLCGATATLFALLHRDVTGAGEHVDISMQEVVASTMVIAQPMYNWIGGAQGRRSSSGSNFGHVMPCKDGYFVSQAGGGATWSDMADFFGCPELKEERFADATQRQLNGAELDRILVDAVKDRTMNELFKTASEEFRMLFGIVQTPEDLTHCEQLKARDFYEKLDHPDIGKINVPFRLFSISEGSAACRLRPSRLGEYNHEIYGDRFGWTERELGDLRMHNVI